MKTSLRPLSLNVALFAAPVILIEFLWAKCFRTGASLCLCLHVDVYRLVSSLTLTECVGVFFAKHGIYAKTSVIDFRVRRKSEGRRLMWCRWWCHRVFFVFVFFSRFLSGRFNVVQKCCGENQLDGSRSCDLIPLQVHWCSDVQTMRMNLGHIKLLYCSAEPLSPCFTFPAGRRVTLLFCVVRWELSTNCKYLAHTDCVLPCVCLLSLQQTFSKARRKQSVNRRLFLKTRIFVCVRVFNLMSKTLFICPCKLTISLRLLLCIGPVCLVREEPS